MTAGVVDSRHRGPAGTDEAPSAPPPVPAPRTGRRPVARVLAAYAVSRLVTLAAAAAAGLRYPGFGVLRVLTNWDGGWYLKLIAHGYPAGIPQVNGRASESTIGFFPFYPMVVRAVQRVLPLSDAAAAVSVSLAAGAVAVALVYRLALCVTDRESAERGAVLFAFFPGSLVLSMAYTEALMLALSAGSLLAALRRRWVLAGVLAALATACRPTALALVPALAWQAAMAIRARREFRSAVAPLLAPLGVVAFFAFLKVRTGDFFAWFRVEREGWQQGPHLGWSAFQPVVHFVEAPFGDARAAVLGVGLLFAVASGAILLRRRWPGLLTVYTGAIVFMSANARLDAVRPRALLTTFPLVLAVGAAARPRLFRWLVAVSALLLFVVTIRYNTYGLDQI